MSMSIERALLGKARPYMLAAKAKAIVRQEVSKGCLPDILARPVALEPAYDPVLGGEDPFQRDRAECCVYENPPAEDELVRLQLWISPEQTCEWVRSELLIKQLSHTHRRIALEIVGNKDRIGVQILCHEADQPIVRASFLGQLEQCMLTFTHADLLRQLPLDAWAGALFRDFFPPPPYSHLFTRPDELKRSPYATLIAVLAEIPAPTIGVYQVVFEPVSPEHDWHQNVQALLDLEYSIKLIGGLAHAQQLAQQAPSGDLRQMAMDVEVKSHTDKPFFAAALRIGVLDGGEHAPDMLRSLAVVAGLIQHGGRLPTTATRHRTGRRILSRLQQEQVQQWARENGIEIIHEFSDRGKSGLTAEGRDGFNDMMDNWVKGGREFDFVLCLDVSRWGRFQDIDLSATYSAECKRHGKQVIYTTLGKPKPGDQLYQVYVQFERFRAAQYSKELSDKVFRGCVKITEQGYWAGGNPPFGLQRLLLDEARKRVQTLAPGQRKSIQNQRVTLTLGDELQAATVQRIFREFTETLRSMREIAEALNRDGIASPGGGTWDRPKVRGILLNELYVGTLVYNRTTQKLKTPTHHNPKEEWVKTADAFDPLVNRVVFDEGQRIQAQAALKYTPEFMLEQLRRVLEAHEFLRPALLQADAAAPSPSTYAKHFASLDAAYQQVFRCALQQVTKEVESQLRTLVEEVENYDDFLVLNGRFTILVRRSVAEPKKRIGCIHLDNGKSLKAIMQRVRELMCQRLGVNRAPSCVNQRPGRQDEHTHYH